MFTALGGNFGNLRDALIGGATRRAEQAYVAYSGATFALNAYQTVSSVYDAASECFGAACKFLEDIIVGLKNEELNLSDYRSLIRDTILIIKQNNNLTDKEKSELEAVMTKMFELITLMIEIDKLIKASFDDKNQQITNWPELRKKFNDITSKAASLSGATQRCAKTMSHIPEINQMLPICDALDTHVLNMKEFSDKAKFESGAANKKDDRTRSGCLYFEAGCYFCFYMALTPLVAISSRMIYCASALSSKNREGTSESLPWLKKANVFLYETPAVSKALSKSIYRDAERLRNLGAINASVEELTEKYQDSMDDLYLKTADFSESIEAGSKNDQKQRH